MQLLSPDLNLKNLTHTVFLGMQVIIDEWYWLLTDTLFKLSMRKLHAQLLQTTDTYKQDELKKQIDLRNQAHDNFREVQILLRSHDLT